MCDCFVQIINHTVYGVHNVSASSYNTCVAKKQLLIRDYSVRVTRDLLILTKQFDARNYVFAIIAELNYINYVVTYFNPERLSVRTEIDYFKINV